MNYTCWFSPIHSNPLSEVFFIPTELDRFKEWDLGSLVGLSAEVIANKLENLQAGKSKHKILHKECKKLAQMCEKHPGEFLRCEQFPSSPSAKTLKTALSELSWNTEQEPLLFTLHPQFGMIDISNKDNVLAIYQSLKAEQHPNASLFLRIASVLE